MLLVAFESQSPAILETFAPWRMPQRATKRWSSFIRSFVHSFIEREVGGRDAVNLILRVVQASHIAHVGLCRALTKAEKAHPCSITDSRVLLHMLRFDCLPKFTQTISRVLMDKLRVQVAGRSLHIMQV